MGARAFIRRYRIAIFIIAVYAITWGVGGPPALAAHGIGHVHRSNGALTLAGFAPAFVAMAMILLLRGRQGAAAVWRRLTRIRLPLAVWLVAIVVPFLTVPLAMLLSLTMGVAWPLLGPWYTPLLTTLLFVPLTALFEEVGWRGVLLPELQKRCTPWMASLLLGTIWGLWHLPVYFRLNPEGPRTPQLFALFILGTLPLTAIFTWAFNAGRGALLPLLVLHAATDSAIAYVFGPVPTGELRPFAIWVLVMYAVAAALALSPLGRFLRPEGASTDSLLDDEELHPRDPVLTNSSPDHPRVHIATATPLHNAQP